MNWTSFNTVTATGAVVQNSNGTRKAVSLNSAFRACSRTRHIYTLLTNGLRKLPRFFAFRDFNACRFGIDDAKVLQRADGFTGTASLTCPRIGQYFYDTWDHVVTTSFKMLMVSRRSKIIIDPQQHFFGNLN